MIHSILSDTPSSSAPKPPNDFGVHGKANSGSHRQVVNGYLSILSPMDHEQADAPFVHNAVERIFCERPIDPVAKGIGGI